MITVDIIWAQELPDDVKEDWDIQKDDCESYMIIKRDGETIFIENDYMEPEDATFGRSLKWVKKMLLTVYEIGVIDGKKGVEE